MGSSRPNWARRFMRTSGGTFGLVASSSKGSPGAIARIVKITRLIPASAGMVMRRRRSRYLVIQSVTVGDGVAGGGGPPHPARPLPETTRLPLPIPVLEGPEIGIPAALLPAKGIADRGHAGAEHHRDDDEVLDHQLVHLDEHRRALHRIELGLGGFVELVELLVAPARDIAPLPLVLLGGDLLGEELTHELLGIGLGHS